MSSDASITLTWADGEHRFRLPIGGLRQLQDACQAGPQEIYARIVGGTWRVDDLRETIRLGLIGGGATAQAARALVDRYVDERPLLESVPIAQAIIVAALVGVPGDPVGKPVGGEETMAASSSPPSMESEPRSDGRPGRSTI